MHKRKRAQASMEFLLTYGWVILSVLIIIGALAYYGVINPRNLLPDRCNIKIGFLCKDYKLSTTSASLLLENKVGRQVTLHEVRLIDKRSALEVCRTAFGTLPTIENGDSLEVESDCSGIQTFNNKNTYKIEIDYAIGTGTTIHLVTGDLYTLAEES